MTVLRILRLKVLCQINDLVKTYFMRKFKNFTIKINIGRDTNEIRHYVLGTVCKNFSAIIYHEYN